MMDPLSLEKINLLYFKNYLDADLNFSKKINIFFGNNGMGKTNLLDAIHYLCLTKSFLNFSDVQNIHSESPFLSIKGNFLRDGIHTEIICTVEKEQKKIIKKDKKAYEKFSEHIGFLPLVVISPQDFFLITEGSEFRRKFLDGMISQLDSSYLEDLLSYNKVLVQRNTLLKSKQSLQSIASLLDVYDFQLSNLGNKILSKRTKFLEEFIPICNSFYSSLTTNLENISLEYQSTFSEDNLELELLNSRGKDCISGNTSIGIHKDDLRFLLNGMAIKKFASQGQQKSFLISLKLAQYELFKRNLEIHPILLLDDFHDKLDSHRVGQLIDLLCSNSFGQIFITDTDESRLLKHLNNKMSDFKLFKIENSKIDELTLKTLP